MFIMTISFSQQFDTELRSNNEEQYIYTNLRNFQNISFDTIANFRTQTAYAFNVIIHDSPNSILSECDYIFGIKYLNSKFNQFNIYFKYIGYDFDTVSVPNVLNVFIINGDGGNAIGPHRIEIGRQCFDEDDPFDHHSTIPHEFAHILGINHTFIGTGSTNQQLTNPTYCDVNNSTITNAWFPIFSSFSENVTRDQNDPNYNADSTGDQITDTPATQPNANICGLNNPNAHFLYIPEVVDQVGVPYVDPNNVGIRNIMSYSHANLRDSFTNGQGIRMREIFPNNPYLQNYIKDVSILYQPYYSNVEIDMNNNHIISIEDDKNNPGHVIVCRPQYMAHKFQPGFEYYIYKVNSGYYQNGDIVSENDASLQEIIPSNTNCQTIVTGSRLAVKIPSLSNDIIMFDDTSGIRGEVCNSETVNTTNIYSTTNLSSGNGTSKILNRVESADPNLENNLENGKYHIINKTTETGVQSEKIIYKQ